MRITILTIAILLTLPSTLASQRRCVKGIPCGGTCIAANRTCRVGTPPPAPAPATQPAPAAAPARSTPAPASSAGSNTALGLVSTAGIAAPQPAAPTIDSARVASWIHAALLNAERERNTSEPGFDPRTTVWVGDATRKIYYVRRCDLARRIKEEVLVAFPTEHAARAAGYARSAAEGC